MFSLTFGLRVLYAALLGGNPDVVVQETYDFRVAARMASGWDWLTTPFSPSAPGYLVALAAVFRIAGPSWWAAVLFNAALGALTALLLYRIGEKRLGPRVGLVSALWLGACVSQMHYASMAIRDVATTFLLAWFVFAIVKPFSRMRSAVWTGFLYLLLVYTEPMFVALLPLLLIFLGLRATHHRGLSLQYLILFMTTIVVLGTPWTIRNYVVHRDIIPISLKASRFTNPLARVFESEPRPKIPEDAKPVRPPGFIENTIDYWRFARFSESPGAPEFGVRPEPAWSLRHNAAVIVNFGALLPFFVAGVVIAWRKRHRSVLVLSSVVVSHAILRGFLGGSNEARLPAEPLVILVAFYGLRELLEMRRAAGEAVSEAD